MDLILMRHPPPEVATNVCYGRTDIAPLAAGFDVALAAMHARLGRVLGERKPTVIHSSPLRRARVAATVMADRFGVPLQVDERLAEMNFGDWELRAWDDIDRSALDAWAQDVAGFSPPGGESARDVALRMEAWAQALRAQASRSDDVHVVVAHAGPIRLRTATALGLPTTACLSWALDFGGLCHLHIADDGQTRLIRWNA
ncbi:alpha-ribazole phosphatase family protein [Pandoraea sp. NPDC087047]|uniref:alpha-ribazole phosphatase family protein n=1 Tax=Pandoraea sp. NPDC087047 TaxID=3364390 RepID=UPI0037F5EFFA